METQIIFYFIALLGVFFHLAMKFRDSYTAKQLFDWKYHIIFSGFSLLTAWVLIAFKPSILPFLPDIGSDLINNYLAWFIIAYFSDSVWKNVENSGKEKLNIQDALKSDDVQPDPNDPKPR